jgi:DNA modification methylase
MHEPCIYGWKDGGTHYFTDDRTLRTVWECNKPSASREHPTMKPIELCLMGITNSSKPKDIVLDPFARSGSTLIACIQSSRSCYTSEIDPKYAQVTLERALRYLRDQNIEFSIKCNNEAFNMLNVQ